MKHCRIFLFVATFCLSLVQLTLAQTSSESVTALPRLIRFGGTVKDLSGSPLPGVAGITFALYSEQTGGAALWMETQNVTADSNGHYTALLGSTKSEGLPAELFNSEQARWVGVQVQGQAERPRVLLVSAPYALKAGDAETIGGLPPSAFVLAAPPASGSATASGSGVIAAGSRDVAPATATDVTTTGGTANYLPFFTGASTILDSVVYQTGTGSATRIGINTSTPAATLDVKGTAIVRSTLTLPAAGTASAAAGANSEPLNLAASVFNSGTSTAVPQTFQLRAEPVGNDTATAGSALSLLYGSGASAPAETGLQIASNGLITFAVGQAFPGTGAGTVTSVGSGTGLTGGPITGSGTLSLAANACASGNALTALPFACSAFATLGANVFGGSQAVNGSVSASGQFVSTAAIGTAPLQVASTTLVANLNASFLGGLAASSFQPAGSYATLGANNFSGNQSITGNLTATGSVTTGSDSTFSGLTLPSLFAASASGGQISHSLDLAASSYDSTTSAAVNQTFKWQAEPLGNDTANPGGSLNLLFYSGTNSPVETGLSLASNGRITFATGQTFPGTGAGTVTSVGSGAGLTGGPITGSGTLSLASNACASGSALSGLPFTCTPFATLGANTFTGNQTVSGTVTATSFSGGGAALTNVTASNSNELGGLAPAAFAQLASANTFTKNQTVNGTVTATSFSGSGAALTNVTASNSNELGGLAPSAFAQLAAANTFTQGASFGGPVSDTVSAAGATAVYGSATEGSPTIGVKGISSGTDSNGVVADETGPGGYGVYAHASGAQDSTRYNPIGVYGLADSGIGILGIAVSSSGTYTSAQTTPVTGGVWGDTSANNDSNTAAGIVGTADDNSAGFFQNDSSTVSTVLAYNVSTGGSGLFRALKASTRTGTCGIGDGDLICTGQVKTLATTGGGAQTVETYAMQSPENWMEDFGSGTLERGVAVVKLEQAFAETVSGTADYHVFITPNGDSKGLYVTGKTAAGFEVRESGGGTSSVSFDYRIVAKRRGYEAQRLTDVTERFNAEQKSLNRYLKVQSGAAPARLSRPAPQAGSPSPRGPR
ncbi:MAG: hypothetical protein ABSH24_16595 [Bryobacteraceae bacterium]|jgi:hypothetical protein